MLRVLVVTRIFPNRIEPLACPFQRKQLAALSRMADVSVLAVVPYVPGASLLGDRMRVGRLRRVPSEDTIDGLRVEHPRAPYVPLAGPLFGGINAPLYLAGLLPRIGALRGRFDVVLGAFLHPDAWAAAKLAVALGLPYVVKAHGTDVNVLAHWPSVRPFVRSALRNARIAVGVSRPMLDSLVALGAPSDRVVLVRNGVDRSLFRPGDRASARRALGLEIDKKLVVYVGRLEPAKGLYELAEAFSDLERKRPGFARLAFVGEGSMRVPLAEKKSFLLAGARPPEEVASWLSAADALVLPSHDEGTPNVVLEALAAGRPVVATRVGGIPDVVTPNETGLLVPPRDPNSLGRAIEEVLERSWNEEEIVRAAPPGWDRSAEMLLGALERAL